MPGPKVEKQELREQIWRAIEKEGVARFPGTRDRIPNFVGAERCAKRLDEIEAWRKARVLKCNPDSPQTALRRRALEEGKIIYMAVPRLRTEKCFIELDPDGIPSAKAASTIRGAGLYGRPVKIEEMRQIDLIVCGSVAVNRQGARLGKGGGYSDLEFALAREADLISDDTPILTTVHPLQIVDAKLPWAPHDIPVDYIVTPDEIIRTKPVHARPPGILWRFLEEKKIKSIPALQALRARAGSQ